MVGHLIRRNRVFRRLLQKVSGTNFVPDFQLLDTDLKHYVEVAGLMDDAAYAADIGKKVQHFGKDRVCVWDTRHSLRTFEAKYPEVFGYRIVQ